MVCWMIYAMEKNKAGKGARKCWHLYWSVCVYWHSVSNRVVKEGTVEKAASEQTQRRWWIGKLSVYAKNIQAEQEWEQQLCVRSTPGVSKEQQVTQCDWCCRHCGEHSRWASRSGMGGPEASPLTRSEEWEGSTGGWEGVSRGASSMSPNRVGDRGPNTFESVKIFH